MTPMDLIGWPMFAVAVSATWAKDAAYAAAGKQAVAQTSLDALQPEFRAKIEGFMADAAAAGTALRVDETYRSLIRQAQLHDAYVAGTGARAAAPGLSNHGIGKAADLWPIGIDYSDPKAASVLDALAPIAARHGLVSGGSYGDHDHWSEDGR